MKKLGFTLAEILIALTIIGVVAALSIPTFIINVRSAETGPRLAAAALAFERANERYLDDNFQSRLYVGGFGAQRLIRNGINECEHPGGYINSLAVYLGGICEPVPNKSFYQININSGLQYIVGNIQGFFNILESEVLLFPPHEVQFGGNSPIFFNDRDLEDNLSYLRAVSLIIVLKGEKFYFSLWNDGTIKPLGGTNWTSPFNGSEDKETKEGGNCHWTTMCMKDSIPKNVLFCAGHIFENGLKRLYK